MNFLSDNPKVRKVLYAIQWVINGILTVVGAVLAVQQVPVGDWPQWYAIPLAVAPVLWTYLGLQAGANTPSNVVPPPYEGRHVNQAGYAVLGALGLGLVVLSVLLLVLTLLGAVAISWVALVILFVVGLVLLFLDRGYGPGRVR